MANIYDTLTKGAGFKKAHEAKEVDIILDQRNEAWEEVAELQKEIHTLKLEKDSLKTESKLWKGLNDKKIDLTDRDVQSVCELLQTVVSEYTDVMSVPKVLAQCLRAVAYAKKSCFTTETDVTIVDKDGVKCS